MIFLDSSPNFFWFIVDLPGFNRAASLSPLAANIFSQRPVEAPADRGPACCQGFDPGYPNQLLATPIGMS